MVHAPMETVPDSPVKVYGYELDYYWWGVITRKGPRAHDKGNGHSKSLKHIPQDPDRKRVRARWVDDSECVESHSSHKHLERGQFLHMTFFHNHAYQRENQECSGHGKGAKLE